MENKSPKDLIIEELNKIEKPDPNIAIDYVREYFRNFRDAYCDGVSMMVNRYWRHVELGVNTQDDFVKNTQNDTQKYLYDYYIGETKPTLQYKLLELTSDYVKEIRKAVPEFTKTYSIEAREAVIRVIDHESVILHFEEVEIEKFKGIPLPYTTQFIPLAVLCTLLADGNQIKVANIKAKIKKWYWCGVFGEMYGGANETRYALDVSGVMEWISDDTKLPRTVQESFFNPTRLLGLQSRLSAAYKGIMALVLKNHCQDFISGREIDFTVFKAENIDIHHIFPAAYCEKQNLNKTLWNSVVNKTPITYSTNREIGGVAPSIYLSKIERSGKVTTSELENYV